MREPEEEWGMREECIKVTFCLLIGAILLGLNVLAQFMDDDACASREETAMLDMVCIDGNQNILTQKYYAEDFKEWLSENAAYVNSHDSNEVCLKYIKRNDEKGIRHFMKTFDASQDLSEGSGDMGAVVREAINYFNDRR